MVGRRAADRGVAYSIRARLRPSGKNNKMESPLYQVPFVIGVVGHRDLVPAQVPAIRDAARAQLVRLQQGAPDLRLQLLCAVADGADLLVAEVAMELGIEVVALLTFPEDICRGDLISDEARAQFDRVMQKAQRLEVPLPDGVTREDLAGNGPARDQQYQRAALLLARYCSLLVAVWDGKPTPHAAGSARVIEFRQRGLQSSQQPDAETDDALLGASDNDLLFEIRCARASLAGASGAAPDIDVRGYSGAGVEPSDDLYAVPAGLQRILQRTAGFNRDCRENADRMAGGSWPLTPAGTLPPPSLALLDSVFTQADFLGSHYRRRFVRALKFRYVLWAAMAALLFAFERASEGLSGLTIIVSVMAVFVAGHFLARGAHRFSWHRKYLDYRALAEALRVAYFWELAGVRHHYAGELAHESFLQTQDEDLGWIRATMRAVTLHVVLHPGERPQPSFAQAQAAWIGDDTPAGRNGQIHFYGARAAQLQHHLHRAEAIDRVLLGVGLTLASVFVLDVSLGLGGFHLLPHFVRHSLLGAMALLTVYGGIFEIYLAERADRALIRQYRYMHRLFRQADGELKAAPTRAQQLAVLRSLGHACLAEHAQWTLAQRDKTMQGLKW